MSKRNDRHLTMARARRPDRRRRDRHRRRRLHRHAGPAAGQAAARPLLPRRGARARHRGLQLPARVDVDMNTVDGYAISSLGARLRRHGVRPRRRTRSGCSRTCRRPRWSSATWSGSTTPRSCSRRGTILQRQLDRPPSPGWQALAGTELEFIVFDDTYEAGRRRGLPRPDAGQPVQRRLLAPRHHPGRAAAARHPQRHVRRRAGRRERQGRVQPRPARDRLPLRRRADHRRQPRGLQDGRQGDRRPAGQVAHLHGQVQRARGQLLPHPPVAARRRTARWCSGTRTTGEPRRRSTTRSSPACWPRCATSRCSTRRTSTPTSGSQPGSFAPTAIAWGNDNRTCALRLVGHGPARGWRTGCPAATSTPTSRSRRCSPAGCTASSRSCELEDELIGNAYDSDKPQVPATLREARERVRRVRGRPGGLRRRGRRPLRQHGRRRAGRLRRRRHRLGAAPRLREAVTCSP